MISSAENSGSIRKYSSRLTQPVVMKMYLHSFLSDETTKAIVGLALTGANYATAVHILQKRFGNLILSNLATLKNLPPVTPRIHDLRRTYEDTEKNMSTITKSQNTLYILLTATKEETVPKIRQSTKTMEPSRSYQISNCLKPSHRISACQR